VSHKTKRRLELYSIAGRLSIEGNPCRRKPYARSRRPGGSGGGFGCYAGGRFFLSPPL